MDPREFTRSVQWAGLDRLLEEGNFIARSGFDRIASVVMSHAAVSQDGFEHLCSALAQQSAVLMSIDNLIRNPKATEADEYYRRGLRALRSGWFEEAVTELAQSVKINPYSPLAQFSLGVALGARNEPGAAAEAFRLAIRYSSDSASLNGLAAGAAILGARAFMKVGEENTARQLAQDVRSRVQDCAELELLWAGLGASAAATTKALNLAPELSQLAVDDGMPGAVSAIHTLLETGTIASVNHAEALRAQLTNGRESILTSASPGDVVRGYKAWADTQAPLIREEINTARSECSLAQTELSNARSTAALLPAGNGPTSSELWMLLITGGAISIVVAAGLATGGGLTLLLTVVLLPFTLVGLGWLIMMHEESGASARAKSARMTRQNAEQARVRIPQLETRLKELAERKLVADDLEIALERALPSRTLPLTKATA